MNGASPSTSVFSRAYLRVKSAVAGIPGLRQKISDCAIGDLAAALLEDAPPTAGQVLDDRSPGFLESARAKADQRKKRAGVPPPGLNLGELAVHLSAAVSDHSPPSHFSAAACSAGASESVSGGVGAKTASSHKDPAPLLQGVTDEEMVEGVDRLIQEEAQAALALVPVSRAAVQRALAERISADSDVSNTDLAKMNQADLLKELEATPAANNNRRWAIAELLNAGAPAVADTELSGLSADELLGRMERATSNQERWDLAQAMERAESFAGWTADKLRSALDAATCPRERGKLAFALAAFE